VKNIDLDETIEIKGAETKIGKFVDYSL